ncbi:hypothetical protein NEOLEDRAFT_1139217 [Neolentinus lepideus HHB14362 ss-1]|uniref:BTB domain-containing protein n=1 Tax=Neolentinus lepideus HHB14362 ss-1 TaxID=1314782 RepID=A0A165PWR1_9AGAM|nr:hypothetical protein NEOLEDRAFT_1139217 [Neolentinus lepideus HHB14362 ss-1]
MVEEKNGSTYSPQNAITICDALTPDLTISTSDGVKFWVHKSILSIQSPIFRDMLVVCGISHGHISVTEDRHAIEGLLRFCYAADEQAPVDDTAKLWSIRMAARKYMVEGVERRVMQYVKDRICDEPLRVYALACRDGCEAEAKDAARSTLRQPAMPAYVAELEEMTGGALYRLTQYRQQCVAAVASLDFGPIVQDKYVFCDWLGHKDPCGQMHAKALNKGEGRYCWGEYVKETKVLLGDRPSGDVVKDPDLVWSALACAAACQHCKTRAYRDFTSFVDAYAAEVDRITMQVRRISWILR